MANEKFIDIVIRARDEYSKALKKVQQTTDAVSSKGARQTQLRAQLELKNEIRSLEAAHKAATVAAAGQAKEYRDLVTTGKAASVEGGKLLTTLTETRARAAVAKDAIAKHRQELHLLAGAQKGSFVEMERRAAMLGTEAAVTSTDTTKLRENTAALDKNTQSKKRNASQLPGLGGGATPRGSISQPGVRGQNQDVAILGLRPWQLTNLSFQINDVLSGLAMGQKPAQIFAQQIGQILQIFPSFTSVLFRAIPVLGAFGVAFVAPIMRIKSLEESVTFFQQKLAVSADGARYSAVQLASMTVELQALGVSLDDTRDSASKFVKEGFAQDDIQEMIRLSSQLAEVIGKSVPDAAEMMAKAFRGGREGIRDLDKELNFLTATQYQNIASLFAAGKETEAYAAAQQALTNRLGDVAKLADGPWSNAWKNITSAWRGFLDWVGSTAPIELAIAALDKLGVALESVTGWLDRIANGPDKATVTIEADVAASDDAQLDAQINVIEDELKAKKVELQVNPTLGDGDIVKEMIEKDIAELQKQIDYLKSVRLIPQGQRDILSVPQFETGGAQVKTAEQWNRQMLAIQAGHAAVRKETQEQKKAAIDLNIALQKRLADMGRETDLAGLTSREQFIQSESLAEQNRWREEGLKLGEEEIKQLETKLGLLFDQGEAQKNTTRLLSGGGMSSFVDKVTTVESGGNASASNPASSAVGLGQFIESTWLRLFKENFPDRAKSMTDAAILALRKDAEVSKTMIEIYAQENAKVLQAAGASVDEAALYLAHFLGPNGAAKVLTAAKGTRLDSILSPDQIDANSSILGGGKTTDQLIAWAQKKMNLTDAEVAGQTRLSEIETERNQKAADYNTAYAQRIADLKFELSISGKQARDAEIATAVREAENEAIAAGTTLTKERRAEVEALAGKMFDAQNAEAIATEQLNALLEKRKLLVSDLKFAQENGDVAAANNARSAIDSIDSMLDGAIQKAIAFWQAIGGPDAEIAIEKLKRLKRDLADTGETAVVTGKQINDGLENIGSSAITSLAEALAKGENAWEAFRNAGLKALSDLLLKIGQTIVQQAILNALTGSTQGGGGGIGGKIAGWITGMLHHSGGIAGSVGPSRAVPAATFAKAVKYHDGGIAGLKSNEVPAILQKGEEILTADNPRHVANGGGGLNAKIVNVFDPTDVLEAALASSAGEKVLMNWMTRRSRAIKVAMG